MNWLVEHVAGLLALLDAEFGLLDVPDEDLEN